MERETESGRWGGGQTDVYFSVFVSWLEESTGALPSVYPLELHKTEHI